MNIEVFPTGSFGANCVLLTEGKTCLVVDPGADGKELVAQVRAKQLKPAAILLTHAHFDHISAVPAFLKKWPATPVYAGAEDTLFFGHPFNQLPPQYPGCAKPKTLKAYSGGEETIGGVTFRAIPTPGHTPGSMCLLFEKEKLLLTGDTLFAGSCGRTDLPGGSEQAMTESFRKLKNLEGDYRIITGHGAETTLEQERKTNPFMSLEGSGGLGDLEV